jgi:hypothetical protein
MIKSHCRLIAATAIFVAAAAGAASAQSAGTAQQIEKLQDQIEALQREIHQIKAKVAKAENNARTVVAAPTAPAPTGKVPAASPTAIVTMSRATGRRSARPTS